MIELTLKRAEQLDSILEFLQQQKRNNTLNSAAAGISKSTRIPNEIVIGLLRELENQDLVIIHKKTLESMVVSATISVDIFLDDGGFKKKYQSQESEKARKEFLDDENLKAVQSSAESAETSARESKNSRIISVVALCISIVAVLIAAIANWNDIINILN